MAKKFFFLLPFLVFSANLLLAQEDELPPPSPNPGPTQHPTSVPDTGKSFRGFGKAKKLDLSKFIIEPDFYFDVADNEIDLGVSPYVGYNVWKDLYLGGGITYFYTGFRDISYPGPYGGTIYTNASWNTVGGGVFAQYNIWNGFFARVRFEALYRVMDDLYATPSYQLNLQSNTYEVVIPKVKAVIPALLTGVGYNLLRSKNFFFPIMVSYNVLSGVTDNRYSIYPHNWVVQLGFVNIF